MFGLKSEAGKLLNKSWYVLTTDYEFSMAATVQCDGSHEHQHVIGLGTGAVHSTSYYPQRMLERIVQIWKKKWHHVPQSEQLKEIYQDEPRPIVHQADGRMWQLQHESAMPLATEQLSTTPPASSKLEKNEEQHQQQSEEVTTKQRERESEERERERERESERASKGNAAQAAQSRWTSTKSKFGEIARRSKITTLGY